MKKEESGDILDISNRKTMIEVYRKDNWEIHSKAKLFGEDKYQYFIVKKDSDMGSVGLKASGIWITNEMYLKLCNEEYEVSIEQECISLRANLEK